jgi:hypothetical protein
MMMNIHYDEKRKKYWTRITLGYNNQGKRIQKKVSAKTKRDLHTEIGRWINSFEDSNFEEAATTEKELLFSMVAEEWLSKHVTELAVKTRNSYTSRMNHILQTFESQVVQEVSTRDVRLFLNGLQDEGLTSETVNTSCRRCSRTLSVISMSRRTRSSSSNKCGLRRRRFRRSTRCNCPRILKEASEDHNYDNYMSLKVAAFTGMWISEVLALSCVYTDFDKGSSALGVHCPTIRKKNVLQSAARRKTASAM